LSVRIGCNGAEASGSVEGGRFELTLDVPGAEPWTPENPALYEVSVRLERDGDSLDEETHQTGFRRIEQRDGRVLLNGEQVRLRGICHVYDSPATGLTLTDAQVAEDIALLREAGANTVRCHWPMDARFYAACDRAGIMVWTEVPVYCVHVPSEERGSVFADPHALSLAMQMAEEMVAGARNHPSVVLYGAGNECTVDHLEAPAFFEQLCGHIRKLDATRLLSYAALYGNVGPLADWVDVLGINSYWGWYDKVFPLPNGQNCPGASEAPAPEPIDLSGMRNMLEGVLAGRSGLALLLTEFGADSVAGYRSRARDLWSEDYHAALYDAVFALAAEYPQIVGTFPFVLSDYRDPSKLPNAYWNELNLKGIVTYYRERKLAFDALRRAYTA
jgi:beta-glucuronidase